MKYSIGVWTRSIRAIIGVVLITLFLTNVISGVSGYVLLGIATMLLITSPIGFCPAASICPISRLMMLFGKK